MKQLVFLLLLLAGTAVAEESRGIRTHDLYNNCKIALKGADATVLGANDALWSGFCTGYMRGFADGIVGQHVPGGVLDINTNVSTEALVRSFVNYVNAHPAEMDSPYIGAVITNAWGADNILSIKSVKQ